MPTITEILGSHKSLDFDLQKTSEDMQGDMEALNSGVFGSPALEHARQLDKIAHAVEPLGRSELVDSQINPGITRAASFNEKTAREKTISEKATAKPTEKVAAETVYSDEEITAVLNKYAGMEEGIELIKEAIELGRNAAMMDVKASIEKRALSFPGIVPAGAAAASASARGAVRGTEGLLFGTERIGAKQVADAVGKGEAKRLGLSKPFASRAMASGAGAAGGAALGVATSEKGEDKGRAAARGAVLGAGAGLAAGQVAREISAGKNVKMLKGKGYKFKGLGSDAEAGVSHLRGAAPKGDSSKSLEELARVSKEKK